MLSIIYATESAIFAVFIFSLGVSLAFLISPRDCLASFIPSSVLLLTQTNGISSAGPNTG